MDNPWPTLSSSLSTLVSVFSYMLNLFLVTVMSLSILSSDGHEVKLRLVTQKVEDQVLINDL